MKQRVSEKHIADEIAERNAEMAIRAVVFDIGGVLEITPRTGWDEKWEARLHLKPGSCRGFECISYALTLISR
jgi:hypothetical protein